MLVIASGKTNEKNRVYHRCGCIYEKRIKAEHRITMSDEQAAEKGYKECKYCAGLKGDVRVHKEFFGKQSSKNGINFTYMKESNTLYMQTNVGFWKIYEQYKTGKYLLCHRNVYTEGMAFKEAIHGDFHRQYDVKPTDSIEKVVDYIVAHDRAQVIILDDYRKLPKHTKKQQKYYRAAERKEKKKTAKRLDYLFAELEASQPSLKQYAYC